MAKEESKYSQIIGKENFINWVKDTFFIQKRHVEVPESKSLAPDSKMIKGAVCREFDINEEDLLISKRGMINEPRNIAIYLMRQLMGSKLEEIGREFGINSYSSVSTVIERTKQKVLIDRKLGKRLEKLKSDLKVSQEQTPYRDPISTHIHKFKKLLTRQQNKLTSKTKCEAIE